MTTAPRTGKYLCVLACIALLLPLLRVHARTGNRSAHRHQRLDRQRAALPGAGAGPPRSRDRAARRVSIGERGPPRLSQPGHRRHGDQPRRAVRTRRRRVAAADHPGGGRVARRRRGRGPSRHAVDARPQRQVGRRGKRRARRLRAEPGPRAQRDAGERRQRRASRVERATRARSKRARSMAPSRSTRIAPSSFEPAPGPCSTARRSRARSSIFWRCARASSSKRPKAIAGAARRLVRRDRLHASATPRTRRDAWEFANRRAASSSWRPSRASIFRPARKISGCSAGRPRSWR